MQTLWSRAIQSQCICKCVSCISKTGRVAPRVNSASVNASRSFSGPSSTFFYSAFFAAATVADSRSKEKRSKQWDNAISAVQRDLESTGRDVRGFGDQFANEGDLDGRGAGSGSLEIPTADGHPEDLWEFVEFDSGMPGVARPSWPINTGAKMDPNHLPPQSLWSSDHRRRNALRRRLDWKKLAVQELAIGRLVHLLLLNSKASHADEKTLEAFPENIRVLSQKGKRKLWHAYEAIKRRLRETCNMKEESSIHDIEKARALRREWDAIPQYRQDRNGDFVNVLRELNNSLRTLFNTNRNPSLEEQQICVAKICHNLLASSAAPDVHTFNILILGFDRWNRPDLCHSVISTLDDAKIRPNELTCAAVLRHYVNADDPVRFSKYISRMRAIINPLMLARPDVRIEDEGAKSRLIPTETENGTKVRQKIHPTPLVFRSLMRGALKFAGFDRAMEIYDEMKTDGWGLDVVSVSRLLQDCAISGAWIDGYLLWEEFQHLRSQGNIDRYLAKFYACMLALCERMGKPVAYNEVLAEAIAAGLDRHRLAQSAHLLALKARREGVGGRGVEDPVGYANMGDSVFIAMSAWAEEGRGEKEKDVYEVDLGDSWVEEARSNGRSSVSSERVRDKGLLAEGGAEDRGKKVERKDEGYIDFDGDWEMDEMISPGKA